MIFPGRAERSPQLWFAGGFGGPRRYALILPGETLDKRDVGGQPEALPLDDSPYWRVAGKIPLHRRVRLSIVARASKISRAAWDGNRYRGEELS